MPNFKEFIKGFEEKPEAKNPNPAPTPKPQEVKMEEPKPQPKPSKDPMPFGMKKRMEDEVSVHNGQQPKGGQQMPKKDYSYLDDRELYAQINLAENEEEYNDLLAEKERRWQESQKNKPQPKEGSFEKMMQGFEQPKMATEKKAEQYHEPKPKVEMDEDYERSWGPERKKDGYYKDDKGEIYLVEQGDTYYPVNEAERTEFFNAFNKQAQEAPKAEQPQQPKQPQVEEFKPNPKADDLIKRYYAHEFDLGQLHDQLIKVFGSIKPAFEYLLKRTRR